MLLSVHKGKVEVILYKVAPKVKSGPHYPLSIRGSKVVTRKGELTIYDDKGQIVLKMPAGEWLYVKGIPNE